MDLEMKRLPDKRAPELIAEYSKRWSVPVSNSPAELAIGIIAHGAMKVDKDGKPIENENFPGVHIKLTGSSTYACVSTPAFAFNLTGNYFNLPRKAFTSDTCIDPSYEFNMKTRVKLQHGHHQLINPKKTCRFFDGNTKYLEKEYSFDSLFNFIGFIVRRDGIDREINIVTCEIDILKNYFTFNMSSEFGSDVVSMVHVLPKDFLIEKFKIKPHQIERLDKLKADVRKIYDTCEKFITYRDKYTRITTSHIFDLIALSKEYLNVDYANIIDLSCSVVPFKNKDPTDNCDGFSINGNCFDPKGYAYGGNKTKRLKYYLRRKRNESRGRRIRSRRKVH